MAELDVLLVGLGATQGLRAAEDELVDALRRAGAGVVLARPAPQRDVRTLMLTDLVWARAARAAARSALLEHDPRALVYSTTTAALLWPCPGAIRFDAPAAANRPGRHGLWQRPLERRRLHQSPLLVPQDPGALGEAGNPTTPSVIVPIAVEPSGPTEEPRDVAAMTYATNPYKKGLDRVLRAWAAIRREDEELVVAGVDPPSSTGDAGRDGGNHMSNEDVKHSHHDGVRYVGRLSSEDYRALLRRTRVYVTAPRREDYGLAQLEALADGCRVVTTWSPGPYAALPLLREGLGWVADDAGLAPALRKALDDHDPGYPARALAAIAPFRRAAVDRIVADELLPQLLA